MWCGCTWRRVPVEQVVVLGGVEVHDDAGTIEELLVAAGAGDAVVAASAVASAEQLLRLHLATRQPEKSNTDGQLSSSALHRSSDGQKPH